MSAVEDHLRIFLQKMKDEDLSGLLRFNSPAQYIGGEMNSVRKSEDNLKKFLLVNCSPYRMAADSLGGRIIYNLINRRKDAVCERAFLPEEDRMKYLFDKDEKVLSLESRQPAEKFDFVGFSFSSRFAVLNIPRMFRLLGIDRFERGRAEPIVTAGGVAAGNFVPFEGFFDFFVIGDGEGVLDSIFDIYEKGMKKKAFLEKISSLPGIFVPRISARVKKIAVPLKSENYPVKPIVPNIRTLQNRLDVEIMRGCPNNCRFCEAKRFYSPLRVLPPDEVEGIVRESVKNTGYGSVSLASLTTAQYPRILELIDRLIPFLRSRAVSLQIPSLRPNRTSFNCVMKILELNQVNLTFAPETFSEKLQNTIGKITDFAEFEKVIRDLKSAGFRDFKLYLMVGLPRETDVDIDETILAVKRLAKIGMRITVSISPFVPAPHTSFEREKFCGEEIIKNRIRRIKNRLRGIRVRTPDFNFMKIEALFSRGGVEVFEAFRAMKGDEPFFFESWRRKMADKGIDIDEYIGRNFSGSLPWDKIEI
ncbi:MAG: radical SAM protein [Elusimicrobia bacterium]|nr:radical SAM protein [Elusimicrobiota bacterium]